MELKPRATSAWTLGTLPKEIAPAAARAVLLFGPDQGGIFEFGLLAAGSERERMDAKTAEAADVISSVGSASLFGGASTVLLDGATDAQLAKIQAILDAPFADGARLIVTAGELKTTSKLRKLFANGKDLVGAPLYAMRSDEIQAFAARIFASFGLQVEADARQGLTERLSGDRALAARACETVALHAMGRKAQKVSLADVRAILDTVDEDGLNAPFDHAILGDAAGAARALELRLSAGESDIGMLRIFASRAFRMRDMLTSGLGVNDAVEKAKPPVFWSEKAQMKRMLTGLTSAKVDRILQMIDETEYRIIEKGIPSQAALGLMILQIAHHKGWKVPA